MSAITKPQRPTTPPPADDPFYYGWRNVVHTLPDGTTRNEQVPLTLEDALHPQEGDHIVESDLHDTLRSYLAMLFRARLADDPHALVLSNTGVYWDDAEIDHHVPDVCVILGIKAKKEEWSSFFVADEGVRPRLVIELVSPNTRKNDVDTKLHEYHQVRVPLYIIADRKRLGDPWTLLGYQWTPAGYLQLPTDLRGRLWLEVVGLWLGVQGTNLVCYDGKTDQLVDDYVTLNQKFMEEMAHADLLRQQKEAETTRADTERQRRESAEQKVKELEAELARLRGSEPPGIVR